jgi:hypothetical protein
MDDVVVVGSSKGPRTETFVPLSIQAEWEIYIEIVMASKVHFLFIVVSKVPLVDCNVGFELNKSSDENAIFSDPESAAPSLADDRKDEPNCSDEDREPGSVAVAEPPVWRALAAAIPSRWQTSSPPGDACWAAGCCAAALRHC